MFIREDAKDLAKDLAVKGLSKKKIKKELEKQGMGSLLHDCDLDAIMIQAGSAREIMSKSPGTLICRVVGVTAILAGLFAGGGVMLTFFGVVLTFAPEFANDKV